MKKVEVQKGHFKWEKKKLTFPVPGKTSNKQSSYIDLRLKQGVDKDNTWCKLKGTFNSKQVWEVILKWGKFNAGNALKS